MVSRKKRSKRKTQRLYKMRGCNKKSKKMRFGGSPAVGADFNLAYTSDNSVKTVPNPFLAYTGKGGSAYPSAGPPANGFNFLNPQNTQKGGNCPSCLAMRGGSHRSGCKCSECKKTMSGGTMNRKAMMTGGSGNNGNPYPNGLVGSSWTSNSNGWPGVDNIGGNRNYLELNKYPTDPQTAIINTGAQPPYSVGGRKKRQKGGSFSNFLAQDIINLGRQFQYGLGSAYNGISGHEAPINPMPWKGQLPK